MQVEALGLHDGGKLSLYAFVILGLNVISHINAGRVHSIPFCNVGCVDCKSIVGEMI